MIRGLVDRIADRKKERILGILRDGDMTAQQIVDASDGKLGYIATRLILEWMTDEGLVAWRDEEIPLTGFCTRRLYWNGRPPEAL
jgi:predicted methyltransferase